jgi:hypothetical protein
MQVFLVHMQVFLVHMQVFLVHMQVFLARMRVFLLQQEYLAHMLEISGLQRLRQQQVPE